MLLTQFVEKYNFLTQEKIKIYNIEEKNSKFVYKMQLYKKNHRLETKISLKTKCPFRIHLNLNRVLENVLSDFLKVLTSLLNVLF